MNTLQWIPQESQLLSVVHKEIAPLGILLCNQHCAEPNHFLWNCVHSSVEDLTTNWSHLVGEATTIALNYFHRYWNLRKVEHQSMVKASENYHKQWMHYTTQNCSVLWLQPEEEISENTAVMSCLVYAFVIVFQKDQSQYQQFPAQNSYTYSLNTFNHILLESE